MNPITKSTAFIARLRTDTGIGIKLFSTIASADALPIATFDGSIKKKIAADDANAPNVIIMKSLKARRKPDFVIEVPQLSF
jgi:hypothetical protein